MYPYDLQQFYEWSQAQRRQIDQLTREVARLQEDLDTLKKEPRTNVEKIEYKFDQLKIEQLDGTLHIGLSPGAGEVLDDFSVNGQSVQNMPSAPGQNHDPTENIRRRMADYLNGGAWEDLRHIEEEHQYPLDDPYRRFILEDIRKQVDPRIQYYLDQMKGSLQNNNQEEIEQIISNKVKGDIYQGMVNFIQNLKKGEQT